MGECPMCDRAVPLDGEYGMPVCLDCQRWLEGLDVDLRKLEDDDPDVRAAAERLRAFTEKFGPL